MGRKVPTSDPRRVIWCVLWVIAMCMWLLVVQNFAIRGCEVWQNWRAGEPLPEGGPLLVRQLEDYKARCGSYPETLGEAGFANELPGALGVQYRVVEGTGAKEFELCVGVCTMPGCEYDHYWSYKSQTGRWIYFDALASGG